MARTWMGDPSVPIATVGDLEETEPRVEGKTSTSDSVKSLTNPCVGPGHASNELHAWVGVRKPEKASDCDQ